MWALRVRSFHLIPRLARENKIYLLSLTGSAEEEARAEPLRRVCEEIRFVRHSKDRAIRQCALALATPVPLRMAYFASPEMCRAVRQAVREFSPDVIYAERWRSLQYVPAGVDVPVVADPTDSMLLYNRRLLRTGRLWERAVGFEEALKFRRYEGTLAQRADAVVFCSQFDLDCVRRMAPAARYALVPNGVDCKAFFQKHPGEEQPGTIVFAGNFGYAPNRRAAQFFLEEIFPVIRRQIPRARFLAAGSGAPQCLKKAARNTPGVEVSDFVPQLRPCIARAAVAVAPILTGAGVSNKLGEAFATGTAMVATRLACGDLPVEDGKHLLIADGAPTFAESVIRLLRNPELRESLAQEARKLVEEHYDWEIVYRSMEEVLRGAARMEVSAEKPSVARMAQAASLTSEGS